MLCHEVVSHGWMVQDLVYACEGGGSILSCDILK
jgi:hypothetical protein